VDVELGDELRKLGDAELVARVRTRDDAPYAELYRRHRRAATALARTLTDRAAADDVVAEAFEKLLLRIRAGGGPQTAFRPYLLQTVRTVAVDSSRRGRRVVVADDPNATSDLLGSPDDSLFDSVYERTTLARAFGALPGRWQTFLWLSCVEGADRQEIATILGIKVGGVSQLGTRAREGLRRAFLDAHLVNAPSTTCSEIWPLLSGSVRGVLTPPQNKKVDGHVSECVYCRDALAELDSVNAGLGMLLAPLVLGAAAPAYLGAVGHAHAIAGSGALGAAAAETGGTAVKAGILGLVKGGAATMAVVASTSTVAVVAMLAILTAPPGSLPSVAPGPDRVTTDAAQRLGGHPGDGLSAPTASRSSATPGLASSAGAPTSGASATDGAPTTATDPTGEPTGLPTSGAPTPNPTHHPSTPTASATPTDGPTGGPTSHPPTGVADPTPTAGSTPTVSDTPEADPTPSGTDLPLTQNVSAQLGSITLTPRPDAPGAFMHVAVPVGVSGGPVDLQVLLTVSGLANYAPDLSAEYGPWTCGAMTPMAGNAGVAQVLCRLPGAMPGDILDLGLSVSYVGDPNTLTADLMVQAPTVDQTADDDTASAALPPRKDVL
jgi:RNA polymerase sigma factor (sigma-70 family)